MLQEILSDNLSNIINYKIAIKELTEIRLRKDKPIIVFLKSQPYYICDKGLTANINEALISTAEMIENIVYKASDFSIYSVNEQIKQGYIMLNNGIRIGICGNVIYDNKDIKTITKWTSLNIRIPHQIKNVSLIAFDEIINQSGIKNTLIVSPPGAGKTTFIRDLVYQISKHNYCLNTSIIDERGEIAGGNDSNIDLGMFCDVMSYCSKKQGFINVIRSMNPNLIITDEIGSLEDAETLQYAMNCGVNVIATIHAGNIEELKNKLIFKNLPINFFERYVLLSNREGPGTFEGIYNEKLTKIQRW